MHRLVIDVMPNAPTQAKVVVRFEDTQLYLHLVPRAGDARPVFALHPLQEVAVRQVAVRGSGY
ncbi:MAG TPA: hypothetical protein ENI87_00500 [bacterium]|nr:hypothetical protein [bacterium]